jgi:hypothetical protein
VYEQQGDYPRALESYRRFFATQGDGYEFVDPHLRYQALLEVQSGRAAAREAYAEVRREHPGVVTDFAWTLLQDPPARHAGLLALLAEHEDFAPAWYEASRDVSLARLGTQTLQEKREERRMLERFLALERDGRLARYALDQSVAARQVEDARERMAALASVPAAVFDSPVSLATSRNNAGWMLTLTIAEPAREIRVRVGETGDYESTGFVPGVTSPAGYPMPRPTFELQRAERTTIHVKYRDLRDREQGPFALPFDPDAQLVQGIKGILDVTRSSWLAFRDFDGKVLLYFTHLLSYRAALAEIRYGVDVESPDRTFAFGAADPRNPYAVDTDAPIWIEVPAGTRYATVQVAFKDGTRSGVVRIER